MITGGTEHTRDMPPVTPDFAAWLLQTPEANKYGRVFEIRGAKPGRPMSSKRVARIITKIGQKVGVVVNRETKKVKERININGKDTGRTRLVDTEAIKYASAHDLRRAFGTRWAKRVMPAVLKQLMRHSSIGTTMAYYVEIDTNEVAARLWADHAPSDPEGTILGTSATNCIKPVGHKMSQVTALLLAPHVVEGAVDAICCSGKMLPRKAITGSIDEVTETRLS